MLKRFFYNHARQIGTVLLFIRNSERMQGLYAKLCYFESNRPFEEIVTEPDGLGGIKDMHFISIMDAIYTGVLTKLLSPGKGISRERIMFSLWCHDALDDELKEDLGWLAKDPTMRRISTVKAYDLTPEQVGRGPRGELQKSMDWYHASLLNRLKYRLWARYDSALRTLILIERSLGCIKNPVMHLFDINARLANMQVNEEMLKTWRHAEREIIRRAAYKWSMSMSNVEQDSHILENDLLTNRDDALIKELSPDKYTPTLKGYRYPEGV